MPSSTIARNSVMLVAAQFLGQGINTVVSILMRRMLMPERMGVIGTITSYGVLPGIISEAGLTRATIQRVARSEPEALPDLIGHMAATRFATNFIYLAITWLSLFLPFNDKLASQEKWFIVIWSFSMVFQSFRRNGEAAFQATEKLRYHSVLVVANRLLAAVLVLGVIQWNRSTLGVAKGDPEWYTVIGMVFCAYLVVDVLDALAAWIILRRRITRPHFNLDWRPKIQLLRYGWPFALQMLAGQIYYHIDVPLIRYLYVQPTEEDVLREVGNYTTAYNMILVLAQIPISLTYALFPQMSRAFHLGDTKRLHSLFRHGLHLMLILGTPIAVAFFLFRSEFITMIYGPPFANAIPMMGVLLWTLPLAFINAILTNLLAAADRQTFVNIAMISAAAFNVVVNVVVIPVHGAIGSSYATLGTEAVMLIVQIGSMFAFHRAALRMRGLMPLLLFQSVAIPLFLYVQLLPVGIRIPAYLVYAVACGWWMRKVMVARRTEAA